jgi:Recombination endonuclease VII
MPRKRQAEDRLYYKRHRTRIRLSQFKWRRGMTDEVFARYQVATACDWCGFPFNGEKPHIDHDHNCCGTDKQYTCGQCTRGFVHRMCNTHGIAFFEWLEKNFGEVDSRLTEYRRKVHERQTMGA